MVISKIVKRPIIFGHHPNIAISLTLLCQEVLKVFFFLSFTSKTSSSSNIDILLNSKPSNSRGSTPPTPGIEDAQNGLDSNVGEDSDSLGNSKSSKASITPPAKEKRKPFFKKVRYLENV